MLICFIIIFHTPILLSIGEFIIVQDEIRTADVIHVIAGHDHRVDYVIELFQRGYGKHLFFSGGWCEQLKMNHGEYSLARATSKGVSIHDITTDDGPVDTTYSEIVKLKKFITNSSRPVESVIIVSDPYHMRRVRWAARHIIGNKIDLIMAPVPFDQSPYKRIWWTDKASTLLVWNEYKKNLFYLLRYKWAPRPIRNWLAYFDRY